MVEQKLRVPDRDAVPMEQAIILHLGAVHADRVLSSNVAEVHALAIKLELRVMARDQRVLENDVVLRASPDRDTTAPELVFRFLGGILGEDSDSGNRDDRLHRTTFSSDVRWEPERQRPRTSPVL